MVDVENQTARGQEQVITWGDRGVIELSTERCAGLRDRDCHLGSTGVNCPPDAIGKMIQCCGVR